jgi:hypothetical protein
VPRLAKMAVGTSIPALTTVVANHSCHSDSVVSYERKDPSLVYTTTSVVPAAEVVESVDSSLNKLISNPYNTTPTSPVVVVEEDDDDERALNSNMKPEADEVVFIYDVERVCTVGGMDTETLLLLASTAATAAAWRKEDVHSSSTTRSSGGSDGR